MTQKEFIEFLESIGAIFSVEKQLDDKELIYVLSKKEVIQKRNHPRKYKNLYVPYIRVSFNSSRIHTRWNGLVGYMPEDDVLEICRGYAA